MQTGLVDKNPQNNPSAPSVRTQSKFDLSRHVFGTFRFGENAPCFVMEVVPKDKVNVNSRHNVRSYTMKAPLMQNVEMRKDSFAVPMEAILPFNWDKLYTNPVIGDDVDASKVGTTVDNFPYLLLSAYKTEFTRVAALPHTSQAETSSALEASLRLLTIGECFFSNGSLMSSLGYRMADFGEMKMILTTAPGETLRKSYDFYFDAFIRHLFSLLSRFQIAYAGKNWIVGPTDVSPVSSNLHYLSIRALLEILREDCTAVSIDTVTLASGRNYSDCDFLMNASSGIAPYYLSCEPWHALASIPKIPVNIARLWAYQLINAHYYSNDHVDFIYSAELYRQNIASIIDNLNGQVGFTYNGISTYYDYLSASYFYDNISVGLGDSYLLAYLQCLMSFRHSLRYIDYFVGGRVSPLAIGDVSAQVSGGFVSAVDTTRSIQMQRFLNAVNRAGRKFSNYVQELFGVTPQQDFHNPIYLGHTKDDIYTVETENTGAALMTEANSVKSNFRSNSERYLLEYFADRPAIVMTIMSFDVPRIYTRAMERQLFHRDRFDMFNPFMQFLGDQRVYEAELKPIASGNQSQPELYRTFAYQNRHEEYKQSFHTCFGGFVENLPAWTFLADSYDADAAYEKTISPLFIHSRTADFDRFYVSLTGYSLGSYFHFIVDNYNINQPSRPMAFNPNIL